MAYLHINNLYKDQSILMFKECFALEKIHGTSAHVSWNEEKLGFFSGGSNHELFCSLFDHDRLTEKFKELGHPRVIVYGEAYGGKLQGMSKTYGVEMKFVAFEVRIEYSWLDVPNAESVAVDLGFDFVPYEKCSTDISALDALRDAPSQQAVKCGITEPRKREGIVLRPLIEMTKNNGGRIIAKHKALEFQETKTPRKVDPNKLVLLQKAKDIAEEWVTEMRLSHVLQKFPDVDITKTGSVIAAMIEDVEREAKGEIIVSQEARREISKKTALMFKRRVGEI